jgi:hypothetical protein
MNSIKVTMAAAVLAIGFGVGGAAAAPSSPRTQIDRTAVEEVGHRDWRPDRPGRDHGWRDHRRRGWDDRRHHRRWSHHHHRRCHTVWEFAWSYSGPVAYPVRRCDRRGW